MSSLCVIVVNNYMFYMTIMRYLVAKPISMTLNLKPKYGSCHLSALMNLPVPCISHFLALISPRALPIQGMKPPKCPRLATVKAVHSPCCCIYGPIPVLVRIRYPIFRERTNSFKTGRGVVPGDIWCDCVIEECKWQQEVYEVSETNLSVIALRYFVQTLQLLTL